MANKRRRSPVNQDLYSICATRTLLELGCANCVECDERCKKFKSVHHGATPYEIYNNYLAEGGKEND